MTHPFFSDYYWKNGVPQGLNRDDNPAKMTQYKIITDPYRKRFTLEKYIDGKFAGLIYDSLLLDFRKLSPMEQLAWQTETIEETAEKITSLIRNGEDRVILIEHYRFEQGLCRECRIFSPHGYHLSTHKMFYTTLDDPFNGIKLFDSMGYPVMSKEYAVNLNGDFTDLIQEKWDMSLASELLKES